MIRSEFRKLLTVRSTYVIILFTLLLIMLFAGFGEGFKAEASALQNKGLLASESAGGIVFTGLVLAFAGLLLMGHEYRYNTIMYTLTSANRWLKDLFAKVIVISAFALFMSLIVAFFSPFCTLVGLHLHGFKLVPQTFDYWPIIWHCLFVGWGYAMYAFILTVILRSQVGAIVTFLLVPLIGEHILAALLKGNTKYLPFTSLQSVADHSLAPNVSPGHSALVVVIYVIVGLLVGSILFVRRDAN